MEYIIGFAISQNGLNILVTYNLVTFSWRWAFKEKEEARTKRDKSCFDQDE
jgi:hypothetical protein